MKPKFWGPIVFLLTVAVAATPANGSEVYVAAASMNGDATYMVLNPNGTFADQVNLQLSSANNISGYSYGNGIGDFDGNGTLDYIMATGRFGGNIYIFPRLDTGFSETEEAKFGGKELVGTWTEGVYPADMAVADYNGDGNLDFVLNYLYSPHCGLYLGDGAFGFEFFLLTDTTPMPSIGVDAADFNNDGIADFVIAPNTDGPFHVYLGHDDGTGKGDGTFDQVISDRGPSISRAFGIAVGDFVKDPEGNVDLAVSSTNLLEIYKGDGTGNFALFETYDFPMNLSPLDNGDFNRDGYQDLVAADFGEDHAGVAVLLGKGDGGFNDPIIHLGDNAGFRKAVTALPYLPTENIEPVAVLTPELISVTVGETVEWDASESYDEDGTIVGYKWDHGDGAVSPLDINPLAKSSTDGNSGESESSYVYYDSGRYYVTLTVTDDQSASASVQAEVRVEALPVKAYFSPRTLNLKSKGKWIKATIRLPAGYDARMIAPQSLFLVPEGKAGVPAYSVYRHRFYSKYHKKKYWRIRKLTVKFDRQALTRELDGATGKITLNVIGEISSNGTKMEFSGAGTIKVYEKKKISSFRKYFLKQIMRFFSKSGSKYSKYSRH